MVSTRLNVVSAFHFSSESQKMLNEAAGTQITYVSGEEELANRLATADVMCAYTLPANWREDAPHLRWLQFPGAGVDSLRPSGLLDLESKVIVTTAAGIHATNIAEYVFGSMLMFNWNWSQMLRLQDQHIWARSASWYNLGKHELFGQTLGIVGLGNIGRRIAQVGRVFGMRILATRHSIPRGGQRDPDVDEVFPRERLHDLLAQHRLKVGDDIGLDMARRLAREAGVWTVVLGDFAPAGDSLHLVARVYDVATGKGTLFRRFSSRTALIEAVLTRRASALLRREHDTPPSGPGIEPVAALRAYLDGLLDFVWRNRSLIRALDQSGPNVFYENVASSEHRDEKELDRLWLSLDDPAHRGPNAREQVTVSLQGAVVGVGTRTDRAERMGGQDR